MLKKLIIIFIFFFCTFCGVGFFIWVDPEYDKQCYCIDPNVILTKEQMEKGARNCTIKAKIDCDKY